MKKLAMLLFWGVCALLAACGGGGGVAMSIEMPVPNLPPLPLPPTVAECNSEDKILKNGACQSCNGDTPLRVNNECRSQFDTAEYRRNWALGAVNALYAYDHGYFGQGVTVGLAEGDDVFVEHVDLMHLTLFPGGITSTVRATISSMFHASGSAQVIAGARNGHLGFTSKTVFYDRFLVRTVTVDNNSHGIAFEAQIVGRVLLRTHPNLQFRNREIYSRSVGGLDTLYPNIIRYTSLVWDATTGQCRDKKNADENEITGGFLSQTCAIHRERIPYWYDILSANNGVIAQAAGNSGIQTAPFHWNMAAAAPVADPRLQKHWINVVALRFMGPPENRTLFLLDSSNACGISKNWCVAAPGTRHFVPHVQTAMHHTLNLTTFNGTFGQTSSAAPVVAGVLAVMKSAAPELPMTMIRAIMLTTATDLGAPGIDEIYGWGLPNLEDGIKHITNMQTAPLAGMSAVPLRNLRHEFPAEFSRLRGQLAELTVAIEITDGAYYNMPLADIIPPQTNRINFGNAAEELLADNTQNQPSGFAAFGDSDNGFGLRWHNSLSGGGVHAELSYLPKTAGIVGAETAAKIGLRRPLFGGFAFGEYGGGFARTQAGGGYVSAAEDISTEEWTAGAEVLDVLRAGDKLRFSVRGAKRIRGGKVAVSLPVASGDFYQSFLGEEMQELSLSRKEVSLSEAAPLIYSAGYSVRGEKAEWAMAAELSGGEGKLSAKWRVEF